ncbi:MAG: UDP-N-acetylmuramate--alanine ligase, partial [Nitrospirota bacterium]
MNRPAEKIFFSGIGGSGLSAIASFLSERGHEVSGSDRAFDNDPGDFRIPLLKKLGIIIYPQDGSGIAPEIDRIVFSTAVEHDRPEYVKARELNIPVSTRPEYLADITKSFRTIAVSGTSGKSTTAGMLAYLMHRLGLEPNYIGGGRIKHFRSDANPGNYLSGSSDILIIEACESDGSIINYYPEVSLILNLALDHNPVDETREMFLKLSENTSGKVVINGDDPGLKKINGKAIRFSLDNVSSVRYGPFGTKFVEEGTEFALSMPGKHNLYNALACITTLSAMDISMNDIAGILPDFSGIDRRFDIHLNKGGCLVIDDYAHNPHKISNLMRTVMPLSNSICYIFQPHGYGPTRLMRDGYVRTFSEHLRQDDLLLILPIYYAGGTSSKDISSSDLAGDITRVGGPADAINDRSEALEISDKFDTFVVFGARDESLSG